MSAAQTPRQVIEAVVLARRCPERYVIETAADGRHVVYAGRGGVSVPLAVFVREDDVFEYIRSLRRLAAPPEATMPQSQEASPTTSYAYPHLYVIEKLPDGRMAVQATHAGVTAPVAYFTSDAEAIAHVQHLLKHPPTPSGGAQGGGQDAEHAPKDDA